MIFVVTYTMKLIQNSNILSKHWFVVHIFPSSFRKYQCEFIIEPIVNKKKKLLKKNENLLAIIFDVTWMCIN